MGDYRTPVAVKVMLGLFLALTLHALSRETPPGNGQFRGWTRHLDAGLDAYLDGDPVAADRHFRRALAWTGRLVPGAARATGRVMAQRALAAEARGDEAAASLFASALAADSEALLWNPPVDRSPDGTATGSVPYRPRSLGEALSVPEPDPDAPVDPEIAAWGDPTGDVHYDNAAVRLRRAGRLIEARALYAQAVATYRAAGATRVTLARALDNLASVDLDMGRLDTAEAELIEARRLREGARGALPRVRLEGARRLAAFYLDQGRNREAERLLARLRLAAEADQGTPGLGPIFLADILNDLAVARQRTGRSEAAKELYEKVIVLTEGRYGTDHPAVAAALHNLGRLYYGRKFYRAAEITLVRALDIAEDVLGDDHEDWATTANQLALVLTALKRNYEAQELLHRAIAIREMLYGRDNERVAECLQNLGDSLVVDHWFDRAENAYAEAVLIREKLYGPDHETVADGLAGLAASYIDQDNYQAAENHYRRAIAIVERRLGPEAARLAPMLAGLSVVLRKTGRADEADRVDARVRDLAARGETVSSARS